MEHRGPSKSWKTGANKVLYLPCDPASTARFAFGEVQEKTRLESQASVTVDHTDILSTARFGVSRYFTAMILPFSMVTVEYQVWAAG
jgi:hypothetical protein